MVNNNPFYFPNVDRLGNVAVTRHAQDKLKTDNISVSVFKNVLFTGNVLDEGFDVKWIEGKGIRIVVIKPTPFAGALLVKTVYKIKPQENSKRI